MRKRYLHDKYGSNEMFWENHWKRSFADTPEVDRKLVRAIQRYLKPGTRLLEGGCGNANYLRYFHESGYSVAGVDYAKDTVKEVKKAYPDLDISEGDICRLQYPNATFDAYYSGGVIEHFEDGVDGALSEAGRVLRTGGFLFVTVPHMNLARKVSSVIWPRKYIVDLDQRLAYIEEGHRGFVRSDPPAGYHFYEYEFDSGEMRRHLGRHGFRVVHEEPFSTMWGIRDLQPYRSLAGMEQERPAIYQKIVRRLVRMTEYIDYSSTVPARIISAVQASIFGNLKLYVCIAGGAKKT